MVTIRGMRKFKRWLKHGFAAQALILMYHRVTDLASDPYLLAVTPQHFGEQMELLRKHYRPLRLRELVVALRSGNVPNRAVVVTFDDGYADNLHNAKPLLARYDIPATVFVTTSHIGYPREFWWDELDRLLLQPGTLPPVLDLRLNGSAWQYELGETTTYTSADYERHHDWHIEREDDPTPRQRLHRSLYQRLYALTQEDRQHLLEQVRRWAGATPVGRPTHRTVSHYEVVQLAEGGLVEIGAHTVTHPVLAALSIGAQRDEIRLSRTKLQEILNRMVTSFAYPHGSYTRETLAIVRDAGFSSACSTHHAVVQRGTDHFQLPRIAVRDWDGEQFKASLNA
jgi:peptidoglycan/xylan/chitin deacetylase (PgdA/CDA1 family)